MKTNERHADKRGRIPPSAERRRELITTFRSSGKSQAGFCREHGVNATTFNGWLRKGDRRAPRFAEVELRPRACAEPGAPVAVEVLLPNGVRVGIRHEGRRDDLVALVRGVAGCGEVTPC
jgi:transposase-like protein